MEALEQQVNRLEVEHRELSVVVWGDDKTRNNGLRSQVLEHEKRLNAQEDDIAKVSICAGEALDGLDSHLRGHANLDTSTLQAKTATRTALIASIGSVLVGLGAILTAILK